MGYLNCDTVGDLLAELKKLDPAMKIRFLYGPTMDELQVGAWVSDYAGDGIDEPEALCFCIERI